MNRNNASIPAVFHMPAEWEEHERCWMAWPSRAGLWSSFTDTCRNYADVALAIAAFEPVTMLVSPGLGQSARDYLGTDIDIFETPIDDSWTRDSGPCFVSDGKGGLAGVDFRFNAWGGKYDPYDQDALMARRILERVGVTRIASPLVAEGGGLCVDGEGTLLTTETCFLNVNRNPGWSKEEIAEELQRVLGVRKVIWLPGDPEDEETDGHVDGIATFVEPGVALTAWSDDPADPRRPIFESNRLALESQTDSAGRSFTLATLPEAREAEARGERFCRSYVNFYFANGAIIAPAYGIDRDAEVRERLQSLFPDREIVMLRIDYIAEGGGGIHCITQQQPRGTSL